MAQPNDITVFITTGDATCAECGEDLGRHAWIMLDKERRALCLACADLDHLVFLPAGDTALTRRARKHSALSAVVLRWSRARKRYERQGLLVEEAALDQAEQECLADAEARERRQEREAERRAELDREYVERFAARVRELYPRARRAASWSSPSTPAASTAAGLGAQQRPKAWTRPPSAWPWWLTCAMPRQTTTPCWPRGTTGAMPAPRWSDRSTACSISGKEGIEKYHKTVAGGIPHMDGWVAIA